MCLCWKQRQWYRWFVYDPWHAYYFIIFFRSRPLKESEYHSNEEKTIDECKKKYAYVHEIIVVTIKYLSISLAIRNRNWTRYILQTIVAFCFISLESEFILFRVFAIKNVFFIFSHFIFSIWQFFFLSAKPFCILLSMFKRF